MLKQFKCGLYGHDYKKAYVMLKTNYDIVYRCTKCVKEKIN